MALRLKTIVLLSALVMSTCGLVLNGNAQLSTPDVDEAPQPSISFYPSDPAQPGYIAVELTPGESETVQVTLGNNGIVDFTAVSYAADAFSIRNGGFSLMNREDEKSGTTLWLDYPTEEFEAKAGKELQREITITVPPDALPGEYVTGVAMQTAEPLHKDPQEGMFHINQYLRTVIGIRILVPGELAPELQLSAPEYVFEASLPGIRVPISNVGNQSTTPSVHFVLSNLNGNVMITSKIEMGKIYAGHETEIWIALSRPLPLGEYQVNVELQDSEGRVSAKISSSTLVVSQVPDSQISEPQSVSLVEVSAIPQPNLDSPQFIVVNASVLNTSDVVPHSRLVLVAIHDGEEVERFPLNQSLSLQPGITELSARYVPLTGWMEGSWEFEVSLELIDSQGIATVLTSTKLELTLVIP